MIIAIKATERSGTNYLQKLLQSAFGNLSVEATYKHSNKGPQCDHAVILVKHPLAWVDSVYRFGWILEWFAVTPKERDYKEAHNTFGPEQLSVDLTLDEFIKYRKIPAHWNDLYHHWLADETWVKHILIRYEDLLSDPQEQMLAIAQTFGLEEPQPIAPPTGRMNTNGSESAYPFDPDYYLKEHWRKAFTNKQTRQLLSEFDQELMETMGYS